MANEIKFIFTGDTAAFDKAIDAVIKKTNKTAEITKRTTEQQRVQARLQKLLSEEYEKAARKTGSIAKLQKEIKRTEQERLRLEEKLNDATLTQQKRLRAIVELSKTEARLAGLTAARRKGMGTMAAGMGAKAGMGILTRAGLGAAGTAAGTAATAAGVLGVTGWSGIGAVIAGVIVVVGSVIVAFKALKATVEGTKAAMEMGMSVQKAAQMSGKTMAQAQAAALGETFGGDAEDSRVLRLFRDLGMIVDKELIRSLADSGKKIRAVSIVIGNVLIPVFEKLAKVTADAIVYIGGTVKGHLMAMGPVMAYLKEAPWNPVGAMMQYDWTAAGVAREQFKQQMAQLLGLSFTGPGGAVAGAVGGSQPIGMLRASDALTRIGLFKSGADSQLQTLKASLAAQRGTQQNTNGIISAITNA